MAVIEVKSTGWGQKSMIKFCPTGRIHAGYRTGNGLALYVNVMWNQATYTYQTCSCDTDSGRAIG